MYGCNLGNHNVLLSAIKNLISIAAEKGVFMSYDALILRLIKKVSDDDYFMARIFEYLVPHYNDLPPSLRSVIMSDQDQAFKTAISVGQVDLVAELIVKGANVNAADENRNTPLMRAAKGGHTPVINLLIEKGVDVNTKNKFGYTALREAAQEGHVDAVVALLNHGADINAVSDYGESALTSAIKKGHIDVAEVLLKRGADINWKKKVSACQQFPLLPQEETQIWFRCY